MTSSREFAIAASQAAETTRPGSRGATRLHRRLKAALFSALTTTSAASIRFNDGANHTRCLDLERGSTTSISQPKNEAGSVPRAHSARTPVPLANSRRRKAFPNCVPGQQHPVVNPQFVHDPVLVAVNRLLREVHQPGHFFDALASCQMPQHFDLSGGQTVERVFVTQAVSLEGDIVPHPIADLLGEIDVSFGRLAERFEQGLAAVPFKT